MKLIIDGYNLLKQLIKKSFVQEYERAQFMQYFTQYAKIKGHTIDIIFDGGPSFWPLREQITPEVKVIFSGSQETADHYIISYILHSTQELLLISSDKELVNFALQHNKDTLDSATFGLLLLNIVKDNNKNLLASGQLHKLSHTDNQELDLLMMHTQVTIKQEDQKKEIPKKRAKKMSKQEKKIEKLIKKL